jgi:hypothetical protein
VWIPATLCALHNFIQEFDPNNFYDLKCDGINLLGGNEDVGQGVLGDEPADVAERQWADTHHDMITHDTCGWITSRNCKIVDLFDSVHISTL